MLSRPAGIILGVVAISISTCAARPWPDSSYRILVFADQLPGSLTAAQRQFATTNFVGTQKQLRSEIQALRAYNTNFLCLHYQLAVGCGPELFIIGDEWTSDWSMVSNQTNWFLLTAQTQRVHQTEWNWDVMNVTYSNSTANTAFPQYWITTCLARIRSAEDDAVFADSYTEDAYFGGACNPTHPWLSDVTACQTGWVPHLERFGSAVTNAFAADGGGFLFLPNLGGMITSWDPMNYGVGHGGMIEGFCFWDSWNMFDVGDWELQMGRALSLVRSNKIVICQTSPATEDYTGRMFAVTSYLLIKGSRTYLNLVTLGMVALEYYPEYTIDLGGAVSNTPPRLSDLWVPAWNVYRRNFTNGIVLVNPDNVSRAVNLGTNYWRVRATGGGEVDETGQYGGSLSFTQVTSFTMSPYSGAVLLYATNSGTGGDSGTTNQTQVTGLSAFHRSGQTFITWQESTELTSEFYRIYRHTAPIAASNLAQAVRLYTVPEQSSVFYANRYNVGGGGTWQPRYVTRYVLTNNGPQMAVGSGLLVWTLATNDFNGGNTGAAYYAVTTMNAAGQEATNLFDAGNSTGPIGEGIDYPLPVEITNYPAVAGGGKVHIYLQFMDLWKWNPTFHAPHARNQYYGLDSSSSAVTGGLQYAYDYAVVEPTCVTSIAPAVVSLHGWGGNAYAPVTEDPDPYDWCTYKIYPVDMAETWFFGFARDCDYRTDANPAPGDAVVNYTEQRILRMVFDLIRKPPGPSVDTNRVFVFGSSMGGSGTLALALRYPNVFAAAHASQPMTDYSRSGDGGGLDWRSDVEWKWGAVAQNLPVVIDGPAGWADPLKKYNGTGVWTWQNHQSNVVVRIADEMVPLGIGHGTNDYVIEWPTQGQPTYPALNQGRHCWGGQVSDGGHGWMGFDPLPPTIGADPSLTPFRAFMVRKDESVPGLSNGSADNDLPPVHPGGYNQQIEWSASWYDWDGAPLDQSNRWRMSFRSLAAGTVTADVTLRRLQVFPHAPRTRVLWRNIPVGQTAHVQIGTLAADTNGLITVTNFQITVIGNQLDVQTDSGPDTDGDGIRDYWEDAFFGGITNSTATADADGDRSSNLEEYRSGTNPFDSNSLFAITAFSPTNLAWRSVPGFAYRVEQGLTPTNWTPFGSVITAEGNDARSAFAAGTNILLIFRLSFLP